MDYDIFNHFMRGAIVMACLVIGLFFLRFWKKSHDRLFLWFCIAFWLLGINWAALEIVRSAESQTRLYIVRLIAFVLILLGIWDKNRSVRNGRSGPVPPPY